MLGHIQSVSMRLQTINHLYSQFVGFKMLSNSPQSWEALLLAQSWEAPFVLAQPQFHDCYRPVDKAGYFINLQVEDLLTNDK